MNQFWKEIRRCARTLLGDLVFRQSVCIELHHPSENEPYEHCVNSEFCDGNQARGNRGSAVETLKRGPRGARRVPPSRRLRVSTLARRKSAC